MSEPLLVAKSRDEIFLLPALANRHGLIAGATGTGKTDTLQRLAEAFRRIGPITPEERAAIIKSSVLSGVYDQVEDRESAYEKLTQRVAQTAASGKPPGTAGTAGGRQQPAAPGGGRRR